MVDSVRDETAAQLEAFREDTRALLVELTAHILGKFLEQDVEALQSEVATLRGDLDSLKGQVESLAAEVAALRDGPEAMS